MPHLIIECSSNVLEMASKETIMRTTYAAAEQTGLFTTGDIKVRIKPFDDFLLGEEKDSFLHVFGNIMQGRTDQQKIELSKAVVEALDQLLPHVSFVSMNIRDFEKASYFNKGMV